MGSTSSPPRTSPTTHFLRSLVQTGVGGTPKAGERGGRVLGLGLGWKEEGWPLCRVCESLLFRVQGTPDRLVLEYSCLVLLLCCKGKKRLLPTHLPAPKQLQGTVVTPSRKLEMCLYCVRARKGWETLAEVGGIKRSGLIWATVTALGLCL